MRQMTSRQRPETRHVGCRGVHRMRRAGSAGYRQGNTRTGVFPAAVHFLPRGFLVKSSSGKIARAESFRKYHEHMASRPA